MRATFATIATAVLLAAPLAAGIGTAGAAGAAGASVSAPAPRAQLTVADTERRVIRLINQRRADHGCRRLELRSSLRTAARRHSQRMAAANRLSHQLPGEPWLGARVERAGYTGWTRLGEVIAVGQPTPARVVRAWMRSRGHRQILLTCRFRHIGVGLVVSGSTRWWTADLGRR